MSKNYLRKMPDSLSSNLSIHDILTDDKVLGIVCQFLPSIPLRLWKCAKIFSRLIALERATSTLLTVFETLDLPSDDPFRLCYTGDGERLWLLLLHGLSPLIVNNKGENLLQAAMLGGNAALAHMLIERGCSVNRKGYNGYTPLHQVALTTHTDLAMLLLYYKANPDAISRNGSTPLAIACREGQKDIVFLLLLHGADPEDGGDHGCTPMILAAANGHHEIVTLLLEYGGEVGPTEYNGRTALHEAVEGIHLETCRVLLNIGSADPFIPDVNGVCPMQRAIEIGRPDLIRILSEGIRNKKLSESVKSSSGKLHGGTPLPKGSVYTGSGN